MSEFNYEYERAREALMAARRRAAEAVAELKKLEDDFCRQWPKSVYAKRSETGE